MEELFDTFKRKIDYLRISVTDRCDLRCIYCMPEYGVLQKAPFEILTFEEITRIVKLAVNIGIVKIKITGGEPLVRRDLAQLIHSLSSISGLKGLSLTTNGVLLQRYIKELKGAGLKRMNISIDTLDEQKFRYITGFVGLRDVLESIDTALREDFFIKLNVVIMQGLNDNEIFDFVRFAGERQIITRFIELMPLANNSALTQDLYVSCAEIKARLRALGSLKAVSTEELGNGPAQYYRIGDTSIIVGFISPISCKFCFDCNRLRLTADGLLMPCLTAKARFDLKRPLRENNEKEVLDLIKKAVFLKPQEHNMTFFSQRECLMSEIGG